MALLRARSPRLLVLLALAGCTFNPEYDVAKIFCRADDDNSCPSGFTCFVVDDASTHGLCCKGSNNRCDPDQPPALAGRGRVEGELADAAASPPADGGAAAGADASADGRAGSGGPAADAGGGTGGSAGAGGAGGGAGSAPDAAVASDATGADAPADASPDTPANPTCVPACTLGDRRCGPGSGLRTCVSVAGCPAWGAEVSCGTAGRRTCTGSEPNARCECASAPAPCDRAGTYCNAGTGALESCLADADGCVHRGTPATCPTGKPCTGAFPAASCSCGAAPAACMGASGTVCSGTTTLLTCGPSPEGCPAVTAMRTCGMAETCQGVPGSAACRCNPPPPECGGVTNGTVCSGNAVVTCTTTANGCVVASSQSCTSGKPCSVVAGVAACRCGPVASECAGVTSGLVCSGNARITCGVNADQCPTSTAPVACPPATPVCGGAPGSATCNCPSPPTECGNATSGNVCQANGSYVTCSTNASSCVVASAAMSCPTGRTCMGAAGSASCACTNEPSTTDCPDGTTGSRCVGNQVYTCGTNSAGCRTLDIESCGGAGVCMNGMCTTEVTFGNFNEGPGTDVPHAPGYLLGTPFQVNTRVRLKSFGLIARNAPGKVSFALYTHNGNGGTSAAPVDYLGGALLVDVVAGKREYLVNNPPAANIILDPGNTYWMMAVFEAETIVAHGPDTDSQFFRATPQTPWNKAMPMPYPANAPSFFDTPAKFFFVGLPQ
jgi:hypothetical protein